MKTQAQQGSASIEKLLAAHGFRREGSGGNCEWFIREHGNGTYTCITDDDGHAVPTRLDRPAWICTYDENGLFISESRFASLQDYLDAEVAHV